AISTNCPRLSRRSTRPTPTRRKSAATNTRSTTSSRARLRRSSNRPANWHRPAKLEPADARSRRTKSAVLERRNRRRRQKMLLDTADADDRFGGDAQCLALFLGLVV